MSSLKDSSSKSKKSLWKVSLTPKGKKKSKDEDSESECEEAEEEKVKPVKEQKKRKSIVSDPLAIVNCTACNRQINPARDSVLRKHPDLSVLICKKCWSFYHSGEISKDEDGSDEQCRWCGEGGKLIGCDFCHNVFCKACILRNFGRSELSVILDDSDEDAKWRCYVCDEDKLKPLVEECEQLFQKVAEEKDKAKQVKKTNGVDKKSSHGKEFDVNITRSNVVETVNRLSVITNCFQRVIDAVKIELEPDEDSDDDSVSSPVLDSETLDKNALTLEKGIISYLRSLQELKGISCDKSHSKDRITQLRKGKQESDCSDSTEIEVSVKSRHKNDKFSKDADESSQLNDGKKKVSTQKHKSRDVDSESEKGKSRKMKHKHSKVKTGKISKSRKYSDSEDEKSKKKKSKHSIHKTSLKVDSSSDSEEEMSNKKKESEISKDKKKSEKSERDQKSDSSSDDDEKKSTKHKEDIKSKKPHNSDSSSEEEERKANKKSSICKESVSEEMMTKELAESELDSNSESLFKSESPKLNTGDNKDIDGSIDCLEIGQKEEIDSELNINDFVESELDSNSESLLKPDSIKHNINDKCDIETNNCLETGQKRKKGDLSSDQSDCDNKKSRLNDSAISDNVQCLSDSHSALNEDNLPVNSSEISIICDDSEDEVKEGTSKKDVEREKESFSDALETHNKNSVESSDDKNENQAAKMALIKELAAELCSDNSPTSSDNESNDFEDMEFAVHKNTSSEADDNITKYEGSKNSKEKHKDPKNSSSSEIDDNEKVKSIKKKKSIHQEKKIKSNEYSSKTQKIKEKPTEENYSDMTASESDNETVKDKKKSLVEKFICLKSGRDSSEKEDEHKTETKSSDNEDEPQSKKKSDDSSEDESKAKSIKKNKPKSKSSDKDKPVDSSDDEPESVKKNKHKSDESDEPKSKRKNKCKSDESDDEPKLTEKNKHESDDEPESVKKNEHKTDESDDEPKLKEKNKHESDDEPKLTEKNKCKFDESDDEPKLTQKNKHESDDEPESIKKNKHKADESNDEPKSKHKSKKKTDSSDDSDTDPNTKKKSKPKADESDDKPKSKNKLRTDDSDNSDVPKLKKKEKKPSKDSSSSSEDIEKASSSKVKQKVKESKKAKTDVKKTKDKKVEKYNGYYNDDDVSSSDLIMSNSSGEDFQPTTSRHRIKKTNKVVKKGKKKGDDNTQSDEDSDFDYKKSKKELKNIVNEEKESKKKAKDRRKAKEMEDSDSDSLDKEIDKLEKVLKIKKLKNNDSSGIDDSSSDKKQNGKTEKSKEKSKKKKSKGSDSDKSSSDEEDDGKKNKDMVDEDSSSDDGITKSLPMPKLNGKDENEEAKKDLIAELKSEDEESSSVDEDSDDDVPKKKDKSKKAKVKEEKEEENSDSDFEPAKKKRFRSTLLDAKISSSDSDKPKKKKKKKKGTEDSDYKDSDADSDESNIGRKKKKKKSKGTSSSESESNSDDDSKKKKRKRIKRPKNSSDEGEDDDEKDSPTKGGRKKIRKVMSDKKVADETKAAAKAEEDRRQRVSDLQKKFNIVTVEDSSSPTKCPMTTKLVLESDKEGEPLVAVNKHLIKKLKPHQVEAIQFMWSCCIESLKRLKKDEGSGCILAHCMGLGKTLSVVSFVHTVLAATEYTKMTTCLIVSPLNTVLNWRNECSMWLKEKDQLTVYELSSVKDNHSRARYLKEWIREGGIMIIGYEMYRNLTNTGRVRNKRLKKTFEETLVDPGPDLVVCDEGHILKNEQSAISQAMNKVKTKRRIILTGTPLQNNLNEYHCMVSFVKPRLLGTRKEFLNRFVNPITNGQCSDSTSHDVKVMKRRAHVLHEMLAGCVQRKDYSALTKYLPPKLEYVITVRLAPVQMTLYEKYLETVGQTGTVSGKGGRLFQDYQSLSKIWTHPWVLKLSEIRQEAKVKYDDYEDEEELSNDSFIDDSTSESSASTNDNSDDDISLKDSDSDNSGKRSKNTRAKTKDKKKKNKNEPSTSSGKQEDKKEIVNSWKTRSRGGGVPDEELLAGLGDNENNPISSEWWAEYLKEEDKHRLELSGKLSLLFKILSMCEEIGDKVLVFSQSLLSLDIIEDFLDAIDKKWQEEANEKSEEEKINTFGKSWTKGADYFRMDGSTSVALRQSWAEHFNDPENYRARLFVISTKAGGLGINLVGANRAIIFDASWNPSHDIQSIFRVYRFGQVKPVYIYRFLAQGTMEEKIYERQVTKQSLSQRVVDEHQIERHFTANDLQELYAFRPDRLDDPNRVEKTPILPKDTLLAELLKSEKDWIVGYHEHDSLLENKIGDALSEEERKSAWEEYETDKNRQPVVNRAPMMNSMYANGMMANTAFNAQMSSVHQRAFSAENVSQVVQLVRSKFPHLQGDMFQAQVQNIIMQQIMQYNQQQEQDLAMRQRQELERLRLLQSQVASRQRLFNQANVRPPQEVWVRPKVMPSGAQSSRSANMTSLIRNQLVGKSSDKLKTSKPNPGEKTPEKNSPPSVDLTKS